LPGTAAPENQVSVWAKGARTVTRAFGGEGTGMNSMIYGFDWKLGQKVAMLASVEPAGRGSLISAAFKNGDEPWEFMASFYVPTRYDVGMPGNYSFLEDWTGGDENVPRSYLVGPTYLEDDDGKGTYFTNIYVGAHNPTGAKIANRHSITTEGSWLKVRSGIPVQPDAQAEYRLQLEKPIRFPDIRGAKAYIEAALEGKSTRSQERSVRLVIDAAAEDVRSMKEQALSLAIVATDALASATKASEQLSRLYQQSLSNSGNWKEDLNVLIDQITNMYESETANLAHQTVLSVVFQNKATDMNSKISSESKQIDDSMSFLNSMKDKLTKLKDVTVNATKDDEAIQELVVASEQLSSDITLLKYSNSTSMSQLLSINSSISKHKNSILQLNRVVDINLSTIEQAKKIISDAADKAALEIKAKQEADAQAEAAAKAAAELRTKEEAAAKAAAELRAKAESAGKVASSLKKTTITCIKGKLTKKVTAVKPVCPKGYKKK
jgi:hypothetical protein